QVYPETQSSFVPQMLNLDLLGGIAFDKGCYVGQEIVARARRNGVPRRMFRFSAPCPPAPPGTPVIHGDADVGELVDAVASHAGSDLLAVVNLDKVSAALALRGVAHSKLTLAALPYEVPLERR
ncbi:MAG TPA: tRNA-modifying protein YgfZ, partial [Polyangiales bacterium]